MLKRFWAFSCGILLAGTAVARVDLAWGERFDEPGTGVACPFAGVSGGRVLLAGGVGSSDASAAKVLRDDILACDPTAERPAWSVVGKLPCAWGEGACATTEKGIVCVGGTTNGCFLLTWDAAKGAPVTTALPPFPEPLKCPAAAARGSRVWAVGARTVAVLDLNAAGMTWTRLPDLPEEVVRPACAIQGAAHERTALFVFAEHGAARRSGGWRIDVAPQAGTAWEPLPDVAVSEGNADRTVAGAVAIASGCQHILFFGDRSRGLAYHTVTEKWFELGCSEQAARAGAAVVALPDGRILVAGGEKGTGACSPASAIGAFARPHGWHWVNYAIVALYLAVMAGMGFWFMRRNRNADDYFKGGGKLPWWVVSLSIYATMFSSITFLSIPALVFLDDCRYFAITFGIILLAPVVVKWYLPFFRKLNLTSAYEYLEVRFNLPCRLFASAAFILFMVARTAIVTYLPAIALSAVVEIDVNVAIVVVTAVTILYCALGGVEAVVWSDFVQSVILIVGTAAIYAYLVLGTDGGWSGFLSMGNAAEKFRVFDLAFDWTRPCFWVVFVGGVVANLASYTSDQCVVQRYMTVKDEASAAKSILMNGVLSFFNCIVFFTLGVALWTFYRSHPGLLDVTMPKNDSIFPLFIGNDLPTGFSGIVLAAVAAATMSTLSANLNSAASAITTDFYDRLCLRSRADAADGARKLRCGKIATIVVGVLGGVFALVLANMEVKSIYDQFQRFLGVLTGGLGCLFFMGVFLKRVNGFGATCGLVANYVVCFGLDQLSFAGKPHLLTYGALGMAACLVVAPLASRLTQRNTQKGNGHGTES